MLDRETGEGSTVGVEPVGSFRAEADVAGDVGAGLVGVEGDGAPPLGDRGRRSGVVGEGADEGTEDVFLAGRPGPVPEYMDDHVGGENGTHVVS